MREYWNRPGGRQEDSQVQQAIADLSGSHATSEFRDEVVDIVDLGPELAATHHELNRTDW
jgi:hypothetical protein